MGGWGMERPKTLEWGSEGGEGGRDKEGIKAAGWRGKVICGSDLQDGGGKGGLGLKGWRDGEVDMYEVHVYEVWHRRLDNWDLENAGWLIIYNWVITLDSAFGRPFGILINSILYWWNNVADGFVRWVKLVMPEAKIIKWRHSSKGIKRVIQAKTLRHSDTASWHWLWHLHAAENSKTFKWRHSSKAT